MKRILPSEQIRQEISLLLSEGIKGEGDILTELVTKAVQRVLQEALEQEQADHLGRDHYQRRTEEEVHRGYRNGYEPKGVKTGEGEIRVKVPQTGGDDYITKPFAFSELLARVQALIRRTSGLSEPTRLTVGDLSLNLLSREVTRGGKKIDLQPIEFSLLEYLMRSAGRVVSKTMIMEHVWNYNFDPQTNVVEARICRLREKIDRDFNKKMIHTVRGVGYVLKETD